VEKVNAIRDRLDLGHRNFDCEVAGISSDRGT
jgi:hypothetical protein